MSNADKPSNPAAVGQVREYRGRQMRIKAIEQHAAGAVAYLEYDGVGVPFPIEEVEGLPVVPPAATTGGAR
jgi:hypothetical protein